MTIKVRILFLFSIIQIQNVHAVILQRCDDIFGQTVRLAALHADQDLSQKLVSKIKWAKSLTAKEISELRNIEMQRSLTVRGGFSYAKNKDWLSNIRLQSKLNRQRALSEASEIKHQHQSLWRQPKTDLAPQIAAMVDQLKLEFTHNSFSPIQLGSPLLSSVAIGFGRNQKPFNIQVLKTDGQVYGLVNFTYLTGQGERVGGAAIVLQVLKNTAEEDYGESVHYFNYEYARKYGMISVYVMHSPHLLLHFAKYMTAVDKQKLIRMMTSQSDLSDQDIASIFTDHPTSPVIALLTYQNKQPNQILQFLTSQQHLFDFTVDDFDVLVKQLVKMYVLEMQNVEPNNLLYQLESNPEKLVLDAINFFNLPTIWEIKIPYLVPSHAWSSERSK